MVINLTPEDSGPAYIRMHFPLTPGEGVFTLLATERAPRVSAPQPSCSLVPAPQNGSHNRSTSPCHYPLHTNECHTSRLRSRFEIIVEVSLPSSPRARNETCKKSAPDGNQTHTALEAPCATERAVHEKRRHARTHARTHERSRRRRLGLVRCACTGAVSSCRCRVPSHEGHRSRRRWRRRRRRRRRCS